ncbi:hypothetical protein B0H14DRAFT_2655962 [Mycena olivaceomarginata]|nr:hypothetical protein B0H14DRAFT_2655962 [Mycena olivaceomarginata]
MNAPQTANGNCCIHCGNQLTVKVAEGGKVPSSSFIRAHSRKTSLLFHFPPQNHVSALPIMNPASSTTPVVASSAQTVALQANPVHRLCPTPGCGSGRIQPIALKKSAVTIASNTLVPVVRTPMTKTAKWWLLLRYPIYMLVSLTLALMTTGHQMRAPHSTLLRLTSTEKTHQGWQWSEDLTGSLA